MTLHWRSAEDRAIELFQQGVRGSTLRWALLVAREKGLLHLELQSLYRAENGDHAGAARAGARIPHLHRAFLRAHRAYWGPRAAAYQQERDALAKRGVGMLRP